MDTALGAPSAVGRAPWRPARRALRAWAVGGTQSSSTIAVGMTPRSWARSFQVRTTSRRVRVDIGDPAYPVTPSGVPKRTFAHRSPVEVRARLLVGPPEPHAPE